MVAVPSVVFVPEPLHFALKGFVPCNVRAIAPTGIAGTMAVVVPAATARKAGRARTSSANRWKTLPMAAKLLVAQAARIASARPVFAASYRSAAPLGGMPNAPICVGAVIATVAPARGLLAGPARATASASRTSVSKDCREPRFAPPSALKIAPMSGHASSTQRSITPSSALRNVTRTALVSSAAAMAAAEVAEAVRKIMSASMASVTWAASSPAFVPTMQI